MSTDHLATTLVVPFERLRMSDVDAVGGKNASLGEMISQLTSSGVRVPGGFATTAHAFRRFLAHEGLAARIEAVLKRTRAGGRRLLTVADLAYDLDTLEVSRAGQPVKVGPIGLKLLAVLMQKSPAVATREALESALWGDAPPDSDSLRSHIHTLRQQIDKPFPKPLLHTVHGVGFRLADAGENN